MHVAIEQHVPRPAHGAVGGACAGATMPKMIASDASAEFGPRQTARRFRLPREGDESGHEDCLIVPPCRFADAIVRAGQYGDDVGLGRSR